MRFQPQSASTAVLLLLAALLPAQVESQQRVPGPVSSLLIGPSRYDLTTSGTGLAGQASLAFRLARRDLLLEPSLGYLTYRNQFGQRNHWFFPELSIQAEFRLGLLRPFAGGGAGAGVASLVGPDRWHGAFHGVAGVRLRLNRGWGGRAQVRIRAVPPGSGHTIDFGFGVVLGPF
jgi:hypothetical protein